MRDRALEFNSIISYRLFIYLGSIYSHEEGDELSKAEQRALESLSIEEAKLRRIELQKHRHLQSAYQQKERY